MFPNGCETCAAASPEKLKFFTAAKLRQSAVASGSHITGGFMHFDQVASNLVHGGQFGNATADFLPGSRNAAKMPARRRGDPFRGGFSDHGALGAGLRHHHR